MSKIVSLFRKVSHLLFGGTSFQVSLCFRATTATLALFATSFFTTPLFAQEVSQPNDRVELVDDHENLLKHLNIELENGEVTVADIFRGISRLNGYDDTELRNLLPAGKISIDNEGARWAIGAFNKVMRPCMRMDADDETLQITVDREKAQQWINDCKADVRWAWNKLDWRSEAPEYGIQIIGDANREEDLVVIVHGMNSRPEDLVSFVPVIDRAGLIPATIRYPNDQPIFDSAKLLSKELYHLKKQYPAKKIRLLTHSMGGLVSRAVVETDLDPGNVSQLIMISPPNHGSSLARVATFMDCYEFFTSAHHRRAGILVETVSDGLGEAAADLEPNSVFLDKLNARARNPKVRYTILLGTAGPMSQEEMTSLQESVRDYTDGNRFVRFASSKLNSALHNLNEVVEGKGDGAVSCERGKLDGVNDVVELRYSHANVLNPEAATTRIVHAIIVDRLK